MNPIISNALADLEVVQSRLREHRAACLSLQLDEIEIKEFLARARSYEGRGYFPAEEITSEANVAGASELEIPSEEITPSEPEIPTIPQPQGGEEMVTVPEIDLEPAPIKTGTKYGQILEALRQNPQANARALASLTGAALGTVRAYLTKAREELALEEAGRAERSQEAQKVAPAPKALSEPKPQPVPSAPAPRHVAAKPVAQPPKGTLFRLRNADGLYLHSDLNAMLKRGLRFVGKKEYPWQGSERQLLAVRKMLPETINLREEVIQ